MFVHTWSYELILQSSLFKGLLQQVLLLQNFIPCYSTMHMGSYMLYYTNTLYVLFQVYVIFHVYSSSSLLLVYMVFYEHLSCGSCIFSLIDIIYSHSYLHALYVDYLRADFLCNPFYLVHILSETSNQNAFITHTDSCGCSLNFLYFDLFMSFLCTSDANLWSVRIK